MRRTAGICALALWSWSPIDADAAKSFPIAAPTSAESFEFASAAVPTFGRTPPLRLVYYVLSDDQFAAEDRKAIRRQVLWIQRFYRHFGLEVPTEDRVYEVRATENGPLSRSYFGIMDELIASKVYAAGRTVVFTDFDIGRGGTDEMALTVINDARVDHRECLDGPGHAWWCGKPLTAHRGGCVHEVGHLFGLKHPEAGQKTFLTVMGDHWRLGNDPRTGLLPNEIDILRHRFTVHGEDSQ